MKRALCFILAGVFLLLPGIISAETPDYDALAADIKTRLERGVEEYKAGNVDTGKTSVQMAYFEVFENLEGPIRVNTSAQLSFHLEKQFGEIRKMIIEGKPVDEVLAAVDVLNSGISEALEEVKATGHTVVGGPSAINIDVSSIDPVWLQAYQTVENHLKSSLDAYYRGSFDEANDLLTKAQFDGYKNTLLETGIRRGISSKRDYHYNSSFVDLKKMMRNEAADEEVAQEVNAILTGLLADTQGLPMVELALTDRQKKERKNAISPAKDWNKVVADLLVVIDKAIITYDSGKVEVAKAEVQDSYFDIFEASGMEQQVGIRDANLKLEMEGYFTLLVAQMKAGVTEVELNQTVAKMKELFTEVAGDLSESKKGSFWEMFVLSLIIIVREGFEAILVITAIVAYMVKTGNSDRLGTVYSGCVWAVLLSIVSAYLLKGVFDVSGASQEVLEGITMLIAVVVLFFVSHWLISKAEASKWDAYIKNKMDQSLSRGSLWGLWFAVFLAVYREGAETILFYFALASQDTGAQAVFGMVSGFLVGVVILIILYIAMRFSSVRLPLRQFFIFTGGLLYLMAFIFAGKAMMEFIEGKVFEPTLIPGFPQITLLGIFPYVQTLAPQLLLVVLFITAFFFQKRRSIEVEVEEK